jgi:uncharacterized membrane protein YcaP (DUF421 family)
VEYALGVDWRRAFVPDAPLLEISLRGSLVSLAPFFLLRVVLKRESGGMGVADVLAIVLIADAAQNALAGSDTAIPDGILLVATIIFWSHALNWLGYRFPRIECFIHPAPLPLIKNGRLLHDRMREGLITEDELQNQLRLQGVEDPAGVKAAYMEGDGRVSVIAHEGQSDGAREQRT